MAISYFKNWRKQKMKKASPHITWKALKQAGRTLPVPFTLPLAGSDETLSCDHVVRIIPGKRIVLFGTWNNTSIVAKLFIQRGKSKSALLKDKNGVDAMIHAGIPTPKLLFYGTAAHDKHIQILVFERIFESENLDAIWRNQHEFENASALMRAVTIELATQHVLGVIQHDVHLKNFLVTDKQIYTLDGSSIETTGDILPREESLDHLALFFAQLGVGTEALRAELISIYAQSRGWNLKPNEMEWVEKRVKKYQEFRWKQFQKKIFRSCTSFAKFHFAGKTILYDREFGSPEFMHLIKYPEEAFKDKNVIMLKNGGSSTVIKVKIDGNDFIIKRYNLKSFWHRLRRAFRATRAAESWRLAHGLRLNHLATARPVAVIENCFLGLRGQSYLIMEAVNGKHIGEFFETVTDEIRRKQMADSVIYLLKNLLKLNLTHGDLKMTNILVENNHPVLIDLDGMKNHTSSLSLSRAFKKEIQRFMRNWEKQPAVLEYFKSIYGGGDDEG